MSVRYSVRDVVGTVHKRTSARHLEPRYHFAVVRRPGDLSKHGTSFHSTAELAQQALAIAAGHMLDGRRYYPDAAVYPVSAEVRPQRKRKAA